VFREKKPSDDSDPIVNAFSRLPELRVISFDASYYGALDIVEYQVTLPRVCFVLNELERRTLSL
jgi:hypothetical protein